MRTASALLAVAACVLVLPIGAHTFAGSQAATPFEVGATIPKDVTLKGIDGKDYALGDFRGKIVFIHFWSIVCPSEKLAEPKCIELQKAYADKGVVQFAINANQKEMQAQGASRTSTCATTRRRPA
ncbi:MAG: redoxin family protein [Acidobacteria bacterium]|nr:redoxin family protein [Acidobacteriota bacterium]